MHGWVIFVFGILCSLPRVLPKIPNRRAKEIVAGLALLGPPGIIGSLGYSAATDDEIITRPDQVAGYAGTALFFIVWACSIQEALGEKMSEDNWSSPALAIIVYGAVDGILWMMGSHHWGWYVAATLLSPLGLMAIWGICNMIEEKAAKK